MFPNVTNIPKVWTEAELAKEAQTALEEFVTRRLAEPEGKYKEHVEARCSAILRLFKVLSPFDPSNPDPEIVRRVLLDDELFDALRYVTGPPISEDDLGVILTRKIEGMRRREIRHNDALPVSVLNLICKLADPYRFPWVHAGLTPTKTQLRTAVASTMTMHATQSLQTERRKHGKVVEQRLEMRLTELGFKKVVAAKPAKKSKKARDAEPALPTLPKRGRVTQPSHHPTYPYFYGECTVYKRKVDLFIALPTGRMIALEAKDSSSALNSTKRLLNDTAAKAEQYKEEGGKNIISVALLSGVFKLSDLLAAQSRGLYLVWAHDMDGFIDWIKSQTPV
jgi:hypothetical protein